MGAKHRSKFSNTKIDLKKKKAVQLYQAKGNNCHKHDQNYSYRELGRGQQYRFKFCMKYSN